MKKVIINFVFFALPCFALCYSLFLNDIIMAKLIRVTAVYMLLLGLREKSFKESTTNLK